MERLVRLEGLVAPLDGNNVVSNSPGCSHNEE